MREVVQKPDSYHSGGQTILVIEDEEFLRSAVSKALQRTGNTVLEAYDGTTAIHLIETYADDIHVIFLDITLPGAPSRQVIEEAIRKRPKALLIITSAYPQKMAEELFSGMRIKHFLRKPYRLAELSALIKA